MQPLFAQQALLTATRPYLSSQQLLPSSHSCCSHAAVWAHLWRTSLSNLSPTQLFQSGQTNSALIPSKNIKKKINLEFVQFWIEHMVFSSPFLWLITVDQFLNKYTISLTALHSWSHILTLILEYEKRKLNLMVTYCKDILFPIQYSYNYGFLQVSVQNTLQSFHFNCT